MLSDSILTTLYILQLFFSKKKKKKEATCCNVRLIDFGLSRRYNTHHRFGSLKKLTSFVGTKHYVAPEVLNNSYTHAADLWSIGVLAYALLSAKAPFTGRDDQELFDHIRHCDETGVEFPSPDFDEVSDIAKHFIRILLVKDESLRPRAHELLGHPWMVRARHWQVEMKNEEGNNTNRSIFKKVSLFGGKKTKTTKPQLDDSL